MFISYTNVYESSEQYQTGPKVEMKAKPFF